MGICRVVYKPGGEVSVLYPAPKARRQFETDADFYPRIFADIAKKGGLEELPFDDVDTATLPDRKDRDKWRGGKATGLRVDLSVVTLAERRKAVEDTLDAELAKPQPNAVAALKLQRQLDTGNF